MMLSSLNSIHNLEIEERKEFQFHLELHQKRKQLLKIGLYSCIQSGCVLKIRGLSGHNFLFRNITFQHILNLLVFCVQFDLAFLSTGTYLYWAEKLLLKQSKFK
jgi:hypothetical protein